MDFLLALYNFGSFQKLILPLKSKEGLQSGKTLKRGNLDTVLWDL